MHSIEIPLDREVVDIINYFRKFPSYQNLTDEQILAKLLAAGLNAANAEQEA